MLPAFLQLLVPRLAEVRQRMFMRQFLRSMKKPVDVLMPNQSLLSSVTGKRQRCDHVVVKDSKTMHEDAMSRYCTAVSSSLRCAIDISGGGWM